MKEQLKEEIKRLTLELNQEKDADKKAILSIRLEKRIQSFLEIGNKSNRMVKADGK